MSDKITITSTTDTKDDIRAAFGLPAEPKAKVTPETPDAPAPESDAPDPEKAETAAPEPTEPEKSDEKDPKAKPSKEVSDAAKKLADYKKNKNQTAIDKLKGRVDDLTWEKYQLQSERDAAKRELEQLRTKPAAVPETPRVDPPAVATTPDKTPVFDKPKPNEDDFPTHSEFVEALTDWKADKKAFEIETKLEQELAKRDAERERKRRELEASEYAKKEADRFGETLKAARQAHPDFDDTLKKSDQVNVGNTARDFIYASEFGGELLYYLASHPSEADRISKLPPFRVAVELGRLEDAHQAGTLFPENAADDGDTTGAAPARPAQKAAVSGAPRPMPRVNTGSPANNTNQKDPGEMSQKEYNAWRDQQLRARGAVRR